MQRPAVLHEGTGVYRPVIETMLNKPRSNVITPSNSSFRRTRDETETVHWLSGLKSGLNYENITRDLPFRL